MLQRSKTNQFEVIPMFSLISLYFAYRRDVVTAERYIAGLNLAEAPVVDSVTPIEADEPLPLAA